MKFLALLLRVPTLVFGQIGSKAEVPIKVIAGNKISYFSTVKSAFGAVTNGAVLQIDPGLYTFSDDSADQVTVTNIDSLSVVINGTLKLINDHPRAGASIGRLLHFVNCDNLKITGNGTIDGNYLNQTGIVYGDAAKAAILVEKASPQSSISNIQIENLTIKNWWGDAVWVSNGVNVRVENVRVDSVHEGLLAYFCTNVKFLYNIIGDTRIDTSNIQDGIEASNCTNVLIQGNYDVGPSRYPSSNTFIDPFYSTNVEITNNYGLKPQSIGLIGINGIRIHNNHLHDITAF